MPNEISLIRDTLTNHLSKPSKHTINIKDNTGFDAQLIPYTLDDNGKCWVNNSTKVKLAKTQIEEIRKAINFIVPIIAKEIQNIPNTNLDNALLFLDKNNDFFLSIDKEIEPIKIDKNAFINVQRDQESHKKPETSLEDCYKKINKRVIPQFRKKSNTITLNYLSPNEQTQWLLEAKEEFFNLLKDSTPQSDTHTFTEELKEKLKIRLLDKFKHAGIKKESLEPIINETIEKFPSIEGFRTVTSVLSSKHFVKESSKNEKITFLNELRKKYPQSLQNKEFWNQSIVEFGLRNLNMETEWKFGLHKGFLEIRPRGVDTKKKSDIKKALRPVFQKILTQYLQAKKFDAAAFLFFKMSLLKENTKTSLTGTKIISFDALKAMLEKSFDSSPLLKNKKAKDSWNASLFKYVSSSNNDDIKMRVTSPTSNILTIRPRGKRSNEKILTPTYRIISEIMSSSPSSITNNKVNVKSHELDLTLNNTAQQIQNMFSSTSDEQQLYHSLKTLSSCKLIPDVLTKLKSNDKKQIIQSAKEKIESFFNNISSLPSSKFKAMLTYINILTLLGFMTDVNEKLKANAFQLVEKAQQMDRQNADDLWTLFNICSLLGLTEGIKNNEGEEKYKAGRTNMIDNFIETNKKTINLSATKTLTLKKASQRGNLAELFTTEYSYQIAISTLITEMLKEEENAIKEIYKKDTESNTKLLSYLTKLKKVKDGSKKFLEKIEKNFLKQVIDKNSNTTIDAYRKTINEKVPLGELYTIDLEKMKKLYNSDLWINYTKDTTEFVCLYDEIIEFFQNQNYQLPTTPNNLRANYPTYLIPCIQRPPRYGLLFDGIFNYKELFKKSHKEFQEVLASFHSQATLMASACDKCKMLG